MSMMRGVLAAVMAVVCLLPGCKDRSSVAGEYESVTVEGVVLKLEEDGRGELLTPEDTAGLLWEVRGERLILHTKEGGAVEGSLSSEGLVLALPGDTASTFKRVSE